MVEPVPAAQAWVLQPGVVTAAGQEEDVLVHGKEEERARARGDQGETKTDGV